MNDIIKYQAAENYEAIDAVIGNDMGGEPLRFKDAKYYQGFDKIEVEAGTVMRVHPLSVQDGYTLWRDGKPVEERMREWIDPAQRPIDRNTLGDLDESAWANGKDPWSFTMLVAMKDATGTMFKFSTSSVGGAVAIRKMMKAWRSERNDYPGLVPVVTLGTDSYIHKVHKNKVDHPVFEIVGWEPWDENTPVELPKPDTAGSFAHDLNDQIPFAPEWRG